MLEKFEVQVPEDQIASLEALELEWGRFLHALDEASIKLERYKDSFRDKVRAAQLISAQHVFTVEGRSP